MKISDRSKLLFIPTIVSFIAALPLPSEAYGVIRLVLSVSAFIVAFDTWQKRRNIWILFVCVGILFNPIAPLYLYQKFFWVIADIITGILFANQIPELLELPQDAVPQSSQDRRDISGINNARPNNWKTELEIFLAEIEALNSLQKAKVLLAAARSFNDALKLSKDTAYLGLSLPYHELDQLDDIFTLTTAIKLKIDYSGDDLDFFGKAGDKIWLHTSRAFCDGNLLKDIKKLWANLEAEKTKVEEAATDFRETWPECDVSAAVSSLDTLRPSWISPGFTQSGEGPLEICSKTLAPDMDLQNFSMAVSGIFRLHLMFIRGNGHNLKDLKEYVRSDFSMGYIKGWVVKNLESWSIDRGFHVDYFAYAFVRAMVFETVAPGEYLDLADKFEKRRLEPTFLEAMKQGRNDALIALLTQHPDRKIAQSRWLLEFMERHR